MSRTSLRKELIKLPKEHLIEVIISAYSANAVTKEYFEFFLNPDVEALCEKHRDLIVKEFRRTKYGRRSKARISSVKGILKKFASFEPGLKEVLEMYRFALLEALKADQYLYFTDAFYNSASKLIDAMLKLAEKSNEFGLGVDACVKVIESPLGSSLFHRLLKERFEGYNAMIKSNGRR